MKGSAIVGGGDTDNRSPMDFYGTPAEATQALVDFLKSTYPAIKIKTIWEPCCGEGHMSKVLIKNDYDVYSSDVRSTGYGTPHTDFLTSAYKKVDAIITNPPFNDAHRMILKAVAEANVVCMLLKSQYWHASGRYKLFKAHTPAYVCPLTWRPDFTKGGQGAPVMDVSWNIWVSGSVQCQYIPFLKPAMIDL